MQKLYGFHKHISYNYQDLVGKLDWVFSDHCMWPRDSYRQGHSGDLPPFYHIGHWNEKNTAFWQIKCDADGYQFPDIVREIPLVDHTVTMIKLDPGTSLPWHKDSFYLLRQKRTDWSSQNLKPVRYLIFLEDWKLGHFVQLEDQVVSHWKSGECWFFCNDTYHLGTNAGLEPFITMQISGFQSMS